MSSTVPLESQDGQGDGSRHLETALVPLTNDKTELKCGKCGTNMTQDNARTARRCP